MEVSEVVLLLALWPGYRPCVVNTGWTWNFAMAAPIARPRWKDTLIFTYILATPGECSGGVSPGSSHSGGSASGRAGSASRRAGSASGRSGRPRNSIYGYADAAPTIDGPSRCPHCVDLASWPHLQHFQQFSSLPKILEMNLACGDILSILRGRHSGHLLMIFGRLYLIIVYTMQDNNNYDKDALHKH